MLNHGWLEFRLIIGRFCVEYDTNYGIGHRYGWTFKYNGSVYSELQPWFLAGMWRAFRQYRMIRRYEKSLIATDAKKDKPKTQTKERKS